MNRHAARAALFAAALLAAAPAAAYKITLGEDAFVNIDYLLQVHGTFLENGSPDRKSWGPDFFLRRSRLLVFGDLHKKVGFFMETENANLGKGGDWNAPFFVQDAFVMFRPAEDLAVDAGMILLPFSRHNLQGAIGLNGLDYHASMIKFPDGSHKVWRDAGVQLRGALVDKRLQYRVGLFGGSRSAALQKDAAGKAVVSSNPRGLPRVTGLVRFNLRGREPDFFGKGIYFATEPIVSVGVGGDYQADAALSRKATLEGSAVTEPAILAAYSAFSADVFAELPLDADREVLFQGTFLRYGHGVSASSGWGFLSEAGFRWKQLEPVIACDYFKSGAAKSDYIGLHAGLNWWILKHVASVKADFVVENRGELFERPSTLGALVQAQIFL